MQRDTPRQTSLCVPTLSSPSFFLLVSCRFCFFLSLSLNHEVKHVFRFLLFLSVYLAHELEQLGALGLPLVPHVVHHGLRVCLLEF